MPLTMERYPFTVIFPVSCCLSANNGIRFLQNPLPPEELGFIHIQLTKKKVFFFGHQMAYQVNLPSETNKGRSRLYTGNSMGCDNIGMN